MEAPNCLPCPSPSPSELPRARPKARSRRMRRRTCSAGWRPFCPMRATTCLQLSWWKLATKVQGLPRQTIGSKHKIRRVYHQKDAVFRDEMWVFTSKKWLYQQIDRLYKVSNLWTNKQGGIWCDFLVWFWFCIIKKYQEQGGIVGEYADILRYK